MMMSIPQNFQHSSHYIYNRIKKPEGADDHDGPADAQAEVAASGSPDTETTATPSPEGAGDKTAELQAQYLEAL